MTANPILLPAPRSLKMKDGVAPLAGGGSIAVEDRGDSVLRDAVRLQAALLAYGYGEWSMTASPAGLAAGRAISLRKGRGRAQSFRLDVGPAGVSLDGAGDAGVAYGVSALVQLLRQYRGAPLPALSIRDWPDFPVRGVMLDISRDKVPTMDTLFGLVDLLAEWRINRLELYTEHTFAYRRHPVVWREASPMTGEEILRLDAYCRERHVELAPNQNSFGHLERWLKHPEYAGLAECPDGFEFPWGHSDHPNSLNPGDPRSIRLVEELFDELLPHFTSRTFNVGCDETHDVGQGKSRAICEARGKGRVYLEFLLKIYDLVRRHGRTMHFWGDIIVKHPELVRELPDDIVVLEWGYEANHPFAGHGKLFAASGRPFYVCPGTSSWCSIAGRTDNCIGNVDSAARNGLANGASGLLVTDWGDGGHWQYLPVSYLGFAQAAGASWCAASHDASSLTAALDLHAFRDASGTMGRLAYDLGNAYLKTGRLVGNSTVLFHLLQRDRIEPPPGLRDTLDYVREVASRLERARMERPDARLVADEFAQAARMLEHACRRGLGEPAPRLAADVADIAIEHRRLWLARNRPGGLAESVGRMEARVAAYERGEA